MLKLFAAGAVLLSSVLLGEAYRAFLRERRERSAALTDLIGCIRDGIEGYLRPLDEILEGFPSKPLEKIGFLREARCELEESGRITETVRRHRSDLFSDEEDAGEILGYFERFGCDPAPEEIAKAAELYEKRRKRDEQSTPEAKKKEKAAGVLSVTGGVLLILFFL